MRQLPFLKSIWLLVVLAGLAVAGCETSVKSDVARFHQLPRPSGETFVILPKDPAKSGSLEFAKYADEIGARLAAVGYQPAAKGTAPDLTVKVDYSVDDGKVEVRSYPSSMGGYYGAFRHPYYSPWYWDYPWYGPGYYEPDIRSYTVYSRRLEMDIERIDAAGKAQRLFEGRVESRGGDNRLPEVMPYLIQSMFKDFPGPSGVTQRVIIKEESDNY